MSNLKVYEYNKHSIGFNTEEGIMINATQMAKPFEKKAAHFLRMEQTQEFIEVLESKLKLRNSTFKIVKGRHHSGTWMHQKLALKFAAWLSPEFELLELVCFLLRWFKARCIL
jgi:hypothetical protein